MRRLRLIAITGSVMGFAALSPIGAVSVAKDIGDRPVADRNLRVERKATETPACNGPGICSTAHSAWSTPRRAQKEAAE